MTTFGWEWLVILTSTVLHENTLTKTSAWSHYHLNVLLVLLFVVLGSVIKRHNVLVKGKSRDTIAIS